MTPSDREYAGVSLREVIPSGHKRNPGRFVLKKVYSNFPTKKHRHPKGKTFTPEQQRDKALKRLYGIVFEDVARMLESQGQSCAICRREFATTRYNIDHNHITGQVRGLLCNVCNFRIGRWDDENFARPAAMYLGLITRQESEVNYTQTRKEQYSMPGQNVKGQLGKGMKPRNVENKGVAYPSDEDVFAEEAPSDEGLASLGLGPAETATEAFETTNTVEPEIEVFEVVAETDAGEVTSEVPVEMAESSLEELLKQSAESLGVGLIVIPTKAEIEAIEGDGFVPELKSGQTLGEQPDGDFKIVVTVREGYISGIQEQAVSDGITPEEWVSIRLGEYLEQWWFAPKAS